jgi:hypothetical protein
MKEMANIKKYRDEEVQEEIMIQLKMTRTSKTDAMTARELLLYDLVLRRPAAPCRYSEITHLIPR